METRFVKTHEWVRKEENGIVIGITDYAQEELGDVVFVELPEAGAEYATEDTFGTIESVKAVSDLYAPIAGKVIEVNEALNDDASLINSDPTGKGWIVKLEAANPEEFNALMTEDEYKEFVASL
jgi:glycine cleavage system H protein